MTCYHTRVNMGVFIIYPAVNTKGPVTYCTEVCRKEKQLVPKENQEAYGLTNPPPLLGYRSRFTRRLSVPCLTGAFYWNAYLVTVNP